MYGGLFGDLPAAKGEKGASTTTTTTTTTTDGPTSNGNDELPQPILPVDESKPSSNSSLVAGYMPSTSMMMKKTKIGLAKSIGTAGTSMAFVPTTIKRKKPVTTSKPFLAVVKPDKTTTIISTIATAATTAAATTTNELLSLANASTPFALTSIVEKVPHLLGPVDIHAPQQSLEESISEFSPHVTERLNHPFIKRENEEEEEEEPIFDPYDPYVPNDLLQYWDREAKKEEQRQLEADTLRAVEQQALLRKRLEEERQELLQRQQQQGRGNLERLETTGRGRGVSNLPAWMVAAQHEKQGRLGENP